MFNLFTAFPERINVFIVDNGPLEKRNQNTTQYLIHKSCIIYPNFVKEYKTVLFLIFKSIHMLFNQNKKTIDKCSTNSTEIFFEKRNLKLRKRSQLC